VALTAPAIERRTFLGSAPGRPAATDPVTVLGVDPVREGRVRDLVLVRGALPETTEARQALITERLAATDALDVGSELTVFGPARRSGSPWPACSQATALSPGPRAGPSSCRS
jgi:hypothetical protein